MDVTGEEGCAERTSFDFVPGITFWNWLIYESHYKSIFAFGLHYWLLTLI